MVGMARIQRRTRDRERMGQNRRGIARRGRQVNSLKRKVRAEREIQGQSLCSKAKFKVRAVV